MRSLVLAAAAALTLAVTASPAVASVTTDCGHPDGTQVFSPWLDPANYFLAPDGGFENGGDGWALEGGAAAVAGNESFGLSGAGTQSLGLPAGSSATSPFVCVGLEHPTFRYVFRRTSGSSLASLRVSVVTEEGVAVPVGTVTGSSTWTPSPVTLIGANLVVEAVAFRFTPVSGSWQVDDVYVDPSGSR